MTSSEKILAGIVDEAKEKADEIIAEAEKKAEEIIRNETAAADAKAQEIIKEAEKKAALIKSAGESSAQLLKRDKVLSCRRELIDKALDSVIKSIIAYDDAKYFEFCLKLIEKSALKAKGEIFMSSGDLSRDMTGFKEKLPGFNLTLSDTPADINGGFILKYNDILINGELSAVMREKREQLVDTVNGLLFC